MGGINTAASVFYSGTTYHAAKVCSSGCHADVSTFALPGVNSVVGSCAEADDVASYLCLCDHGYYSSGGTYATHGRSGAACQDVDECGCGTT